MLNDEASQYLLKSVFCRKDERFVQQESRLTPTYLHCCSCCSVGERSGDGEVSVNGDDHEVPDAGVAGQVVDGKEGVAEVGGEGPLLHDEVYCEQGHGEGPDDEVCHGQREQEVV